jgi:hypothetical protein
VATISIPDPEPFTPEQLRMVRQYVEALSLDAKRAGEPREEDMDKAGVCWQAGADAEGNLQYMILNPSRKQSTDET